jgi:2-methylcitrate dehydratase PrpD
MNPIREKSLTGLLADFFLSLRIEDIPAAVLEKARELIADTIGVGLNGSAHPDGAPVLDVVLESGGAAESVVWGHHARVPTHAAALVNGTFTHCIELDDTHRATYLHAGAFVVPTALAMGEKTGASGKDFLFSVIAGYETAIRIALSVSPEHRLKGYHTTATVGVFGSAMAASLLLNLKHSQVLNAMGLAGTQSAGLFQFLYDGSMAKRIHPGRSAQSGVLAALFAEKGLTGSPRILEGDFGFGKVMSDRFDPDAVTRKLGAHWHIMEMGIKPHSACRFCHAPIDGALEIRADADLDPMAIESIEVHGSKQLFDQTGNREPKTVMAAQLSTPFSVALALISGKTMPIDVEKGLNDPQVTGLAKRVQVIIDPTLPPTSREVAVNVKTGSAGTRSVLVKLPAGEPENPLSNEFLKEKFFTLSAPVIGRENSRQLYSRLLKVDGLDKIQLLSKRLIHPGNS